MNVKTISLITLVMLALGIGYAELAPKITEATTWRDIMLDIEWINQLKECPTPDLSRYPTTPAKADEVYQQARAADKQIPKVMPQEQIVGLYRQAADLGHLGAMYDLAVSYHEGFGIPKDDAQARYWLERIASFDIPEGYTSLAMMHHNGVGVPVDKRKAREYTIKAAKMGDRDSQYYVAEGIYNMQLLFRGNSDADKNRRKELRQTSMKLLECAANQGHRDAHFSLALDYDADDQNHLSYKWLRLGAKAGCNHCLTSLSEGYNRWKTWTQLNLMEDKERAKCLFNLAELLRSNPDLTFPDLDERCPPNVAQPNVNDDPFPPPRKR